MDIDVSATGKKFAGLGIDLVGFDDLPELRKLLWIEKLVQERRLTPVYRYNGISPTTHPPKLTLTTSQRIEAEMSVYELRSRYRFDFERGFVFDRFTGRQLDRLHFFQQHATHNTRYRQVSVSVRGLSGKLSAHRMIWAAFHNRWPKPGMVIDHKNSNTLDNRIGNLCELTVTENNRKALR